MASIHASTTTTGRTILLMRKMSKTGKRDTRSPWRRRMAKYPSSSYCLDTASPHQRLRETNGSPSRIGEGLSRCCPINTQDGHSKTPLAFAAETGHLDIVQFLLSRGADPNITTHHTEDIALHGISFRRPEAPFRIIPRSAGRARRHRRLPAHQIRLRSILHRSLPTDRSPLCRCTNGRTTLLTDLLTKHNYDPNLRLTDKSIFLPCRPYYPIPETALARAAERNQPVAIDIFLSHGATITPPTDNDDEPPLIRAIRKGHKEAVATLLAHGANPPREKPSAGPFPTRPSSPSSCPTIDLSKPSLLVHTLSSGNVDTLQILLDRHKGSRASLRPNIDRKLPPATVDPAFPSRPVGRRGALRLLDRGLHGEILLMPLPLNMGFNIRAGGNAGNLVYRGATAKEDTELA
ncbi:hypothetical protein N7519_009202 [Penicillium mononematosum]|uniref:uncharacterized protein n=1 Tax=Penicillium mononematosum TaxID=268346 RepID=UPI002548B7F1|nr:uncharacterized protein N7519_009202 [Penicillium mononematosum]KAJ6178741.1 hypothetical protein N7519_009202 [Penicillium mononematosum]